jgi:OmpA-OmpF porin, OOP family
MLNAANRTLVVLFVGTTIFFSAGCSTKNYVKKETQPIVDKTNELDDLTAKNTRDIKDTDTRAQKGISDVKTKADAADQKALAAGKQADEAQGIASQASTGVNNLASTVANLDNYHPVVETSVHFGFAQAVLTKKAKAALDKLAAELPNAKHYVVEVQGGADAVGGKDANYILSEKRADVVIQYLAQNYDIPAHKFYVIGLGKDKPVASNKTDSGRAKNRRVDVRLMTNEVADQNAQAPAAPSTTAQNPR